jgi:hypothetical protein
LPKFGENFPNFSKFSRIIPNFCHNSAKIHPKEKNTIRKMQKKWEDLAKSGYKPYMKYKSLIILLQFGCTLKTEIETWPHKIYKIKLIKKKKLKKKKKVILEFWNFNFTI